MYRPLPDCITIGKSEIEGLGLIAKEPIPKGTTLGISHYFIGDELIRTPLGGFYNHSNNPNCFSEVNSAHATLVTSIDIKEGEELTSCYTLSPFCGDTYECSQLT